MGNVLVSSGQIKQIPEKRFCQCWKGWNTSANKRVSNPVVTQQMRPCWNRLKCSGWYLLLWS